MYIISLREKEYVDVSRSVDREGLNACIGPCIDIFDFFVSIINQYNNSWMGLLRPDKLTHKMTTQDDVNVRQRFAPLCFAASLSAPVLCPYTYGPYRARCFASQCIIS